MQYLMDNGADIHAVNYWSCSAAHLAAMSQSQDLEALVALCQVLAQGQDLFCGGTKARLSGPAQGGTEAESTC
jgi:hypothetical protein